MVIEERLDLPKAQPRIDNEYKEYYFDETGETGKGKNFT